MISHLFILLLLYCKISNSFYFIFIFIILQGNSGYLSTFFKAHGSKESKQISKPSLTRENAHFERKAPSCHFEYGRMLMGIKNAEVQYHYNLPLHIRYSFLLSFFFFPLIIIDLNYGPYSLHRFNKNYEIPIFYFVIIKIQLIAFRKILGQKALQNLYQDWCERLDEIV